MISLLIWLLVFALICWLVYFIVGLLPLPPQIKQVVLIVFGVLVLIALILHFAGILEGGGGYAP